MSHHEAQSSSKLYIMLKVTNGSVKVQKTTIGHIKQRSQQGVNHTLDSKIPPFWITDWLLHVINQPRSFLFTDEHYELTDKELAQFDAGVTQMRQGIPLAYLIGHQEFWSLDFKVNQHTLIPRPDTEVLVEHVLAWIAKQSFDNRDKRLLDLGTGSGCIAISLAHELTSENWQFIAVDYSQKALEIAKHNATINAVSNIEFVQSSWYDELPAERFDVIVSNPPYIDEDDVHLTNLYAEPISALTAPNFGLADIERIVEYAPKYLRAGGLLAIEHGYDQGTRVRQVFVEYGFESIKTIQDYGGNERVTVGERL